MRPSLQLSAKVERAERLMQMAARRVVVAIKMAIAVTH